MGISIVCEIYLKVIKNKLVTVISTKLFLKVFPKVCLYKESKMQKNVHMISSL